MTETHTDSADGARIETDGTDPEGTNWRIDHDVEPVRIRDPVAEALAVVAPGDPLVVHYRDVVKAAGHSCPTAAGAFRIAQLGLDALYPDEDPVRGEIEVTAGGPKDDPTYGVTARLVSYVTGAAEEDGFGGLAGGHGGRRDRLHFAGLDDVDAGEPTFEFVRTDTGDAVRVTYHVADVPDAGPATRYLPRLVDGTATDEERAAFAEAWHGRVERVLAEDDLFTVEVVEG
jgi:formylmethanofuran dehydrogenase subunit E